MHSKEPIRKMADEATLWTEEKLTTLLEKIVTRALDEQQKNLFSIISGNFEISKQQIAELKKEINELRHTIEHTENVLENKVARVEENLEHIETLSLYFFFFFRINNSSDIWIDLAHSHKVSS